MLERITRINNNRVACKGVEEKVEADHINKHPEGSKDKINITKTLMKQEEINEGDALRSNDDIKLIGLNWLRMIKGHDNVELRVDEDDVDKNPKYSESKWHCEIAVQGKKHEDWKSTSPKLLAELNIVWNLGPIRLIERVTTVKTKGLDQPETMMDIKDLVAVASWEELVSIEKVAFPYIWRWIFEEFFPQPPHPSYPKDHVEWSTDKNYLRALKQSAVTTDSNMSQRGKELEQTSAEGFKKMIESSRKQSHQNMKMTLRDVNNFEKLKEVNAKKGLRQYWRKKTHTSSAFNNPMVEATRM
ncbi:hypothetical protein PPACK8108_LOCUS3218 [Phakopsora pachyrhizi]|uniref:Uncharacterized protein n=1 Tax=Phakopsora pachyrhizi TaxID=170000 RepID=A0AAV0AL46_PHAPC|nr:hypothetical protein PPACK8108_LOCUS3218 [Phakopsora pachyrhizi]